MKKKKKTEEENRKKGTRKQAPTDTTVKVHKEQRNVVVSSRGISLNKL